MALGILALTLMAAGWAGAAMAFSGNDSSTILGAESNIQASTVEYPISIQGILTDGNGDPVSNGAHDITFSIYDDATGGTRLWQESQTLVSSGGLFDALLGSSSPMDPSVVDDNPEAYLGIRIGTDAELAPRIRLAYAPYAIKAVRSDDSDTLDGFDSSDFALKGELQSSGAATIVASSYAPFSNGVVDSDNNVGTYSDIVIGPDGFPIISYYDESGRDLKVARCSTIDCSRAIINTLDSAGLVGQYTSITIGDDDLPIISYFDDSNDSLKVAHCSNPLCSRTTISTVYTGGVGQYSSIAIGEDGMPVVSFYDKDSNDLLFIQCEDEECTEVNFNSVDEAGEVGSHASMAIGLDDLPIISYYDETNGTLEVAHCTKDDCDVSGITTVDSTGDTGQYTSLVIGNDGLAIISYYDVGSENLKVAHCSNTACTSATLSTVDSIGKVGKFSDISIGVDGLPLISYFDETGGNLKLAHCDNVSCSTTYGIVTVDWPGVVGQHSANVTSIDGLPIIIYYDDSSGALKAARCAKVACEIP